jgi:hypothetical protein
MELKSVVTVLETLLTVIDTLSEALHRITPELALSENTLHVPALNVVSVPPYFSVTAFGGVSTFRTGVLLQACSPLAETLNV